jgi:hypothetical protein
MLNKRCGKRNFRGKLWLFYGLNVNEDASRRVFNQLPPKAYFFTGGNKEDLISRIIHYDSTENKEPSTRQQIDAFLSPKGELAKGKLPEIGQLYYDTFSPVDRYGQFLGYVRYPHRVSKKEIIIVINCLMMISENSWGIYQELSAQNMLEQTEQTWKEYILHLGTALKQ